MNMTKVFMMVDKTHTKNQILKFRLVAVSRLIMQAFAQVLMWIAIIASWAAFVSFFQFDVIPMESPLMIVMALGFVMLNLTLFSLIILSTDIECRQEFITQKKLDTEYEQYKKLYEHGLEDEFDKLKKVM